jgi:antitoxin component YwqK of YwqJK toxin-antitoxin module
MTRQEQLALCNKCLNREFDPKQGLICNLTGKIADFEHNCENFSRDESVKEKISENMEISDREIYTDLDENAINKLKVHQDFYYALAGGIVAALISAVIWAVVTVGTQVQIGFMAIGVGLLVGYAVRFFGAGIDQKFGFLGAFLSLLGCLTGNLFSQVGFIAQSQSLGYFETLTYLNVGLIIDILVESFNPLDLLFYGIAIFEGYKLSFRKVSTREIITLQSGQQAGYPAFYKLRLPLVILSIVLLGVFTLGIRKGVSGFKTYKYESGMRMSEGELVHSQENGKWTYWYENGNLKLEAYYIHGIPDSMWKWYDESGRLQKTGNYQNGLEHGEWIYYYENGAVRDSGNFSQSRMDGEWKSWFLNGNVYQDVSYKRNIPHGTWRVYFENGNLNAEGVFENGERRGKWVSYYEDGQLQSTINYLHDNQMLIEEAWDMKGRQLVKDGNGTYKTYSKDGVVLGEGKVENGKRTRKWTTYFEDGKLNEEGIFENDVYRVLNSWDHHGNHNVKDGTGEYFSFYPDNSVYESGNIQNGLREGEWAIYFQNSDAVYQEINYLNGKANGLINIYYEDGQLSSSGMMKDGLKDGEWSWYHMNGNLSSTVNFRNDKKEGEQILWSEVGEKTKEETYKDGELIEEKIFERE